MLSDGGEVLDEEIEVVALTGEAGDDISKVLLKIDNM